MLDWEHVPVDVLELIVHRSTKNTRKALRACSTGNKMLVESTKVRSIEKLFIEILGTKKNPNFQIANHKSGVSCRSSFPTFELFQKELLHILKSVYCVEYLNLKIENDSFGHPIKLANRCEFQQTLLVENLEINVKTKYQLKNILSQMEPIYLGAVSINSDFGSTKIYDMPQILNLAKFSIHCYFQDYRSTKFLVADKKGMSFHEIIAAGALKYRQSLEETASRARLLEKKIRAYIKYCLLTINERCHKFEFKNVRNMNFMNVFKGIFHITLKDFEQTVFIPPQDRTSEYVLKLSYKKETHNFFDYGGHSVSGVRILKSTIPLPFLQTEYAYFM